jgi:hypothetical protein
MVMQEGMAHMQKMAKVELQAGKSFVFQQGGKHMMLFDPAKSFKQGDQVQVKLILSDGTQTVVSFQVKKMTMTGSGHHHMEGR